MLYENEAGLFTLLLFTLEVLTVFSNGLKEIVSPDDLWINANTEAEQAQIRTRCSEEPLLTLEQ